MLSHNEHRSRSALVFRCNSLEEEVGRLREELDAAYTEIRKHNDHVKCVFNRKVWEAAEAAGEESDE